MSVNRERPESDLFKRKFEGRERNSRRAARTRRLQKHDFGRGGGGEGFAGERRGERELLALLQDDKIFHALSEHRRLTAWLFIWLRHSPDEAAAVIIALRNGGIARDRTPRSVCVSSANNFSLFLSRARAGIK